MMELTLTHKQARKRSNVDTCQTRDPRTRARARAHREDDGAARCHLGQFQRRVTRRLRSHPPSEQYRISRLCRSAGAIFMSSRVG